jgi:hypothetical protein
VEKQVREMALKLCPDEAIIEEAEPVIAEVIKRNGYDERIADHVNLVRERLQAFQSLAAIDEWWGDKMPALRLTPVGRAVAHANFKRLWPDVGIPSLETSL